MVTKMKVNLVAVLILGMMMLSLSCIQLEVSAQGGDQIKVSERLTVDNAGDGRDEISIS